MITTRSFGFTPDGKQATLYTLVSGTGLEVSITDLGGTLVSINVPGGNGKKTDVLLGYDSVEGYFPNVGYIGALIGRVGNRIAAGRCEVNGVELRLAQNSHGQHLHGGNVGYDHIFWSAQPDEANDRLILKHLSPDGDEGYPGNLEITVIYSVAENELMISYEATTDRDTIVNLTNHAYFNLSGCAGDIMNHIASINADYYTPVDDKLIPTGEIRPVDDTPFDLRKPVRLGDRLALSDECEQMKKGGGFDHNFCLNASGMRECMSFFCPSTGITMKVSTDQPGVQFYTANTLCAVNPGKGGASYGKRAGFCVETQNYPDAVNHPNFPTPVLKAGERYSTKTTFKFSVK
ncbi:MAG: aldose epimerase family protein [Clostridia bacterium]|nr:aldose epimerase family protein [Clostridia bacterium]